MSPVTKVCKPRTKSGSPIERRSSPESKPAQVDFEFLNFSHPSEAKDSKFRRKVRSHVTRHQHQREQLALTAARLASATPRPGRLSDSALPQVHFDGSNSACNTPAPSLSPSPSPSAISSTYDHSRATTPTPGLTPSPSPPSFAFGQGVRTDLYPLEWGPSIPIVLSHYLSTIAAQTSLFNGPQGTYFLHKIWFPFLLSTPVSQHALLLLSASHLSSQNGPKAHSISLPDLRGIAISAINTSLLDSNTRSSDPVIAAILLLATYEITYGHEATYRMHMSGLQRLILMRGGLGRLGQSKLLQRMLLWLDSNAAYKTGKDIMFPLHIFPADELHPAPEPGRLGGVAHG
ncbi:hypothetical protein C1H76_5826 [Elsinoe australis]|uniref:Uncharacterized protein n=1 Tax=Elsinoe australis TaxID=40998 RepID=A0A4U7B1J2_9PEZI|nr:hypothetical protein C1H76_5826 [Elsinoe australis]